MPDIKIINYVTHVNKRSHYSYHICFSNLIRIGDGFISILNAILNARFYKIGVGFLKT